MYGIRSMGREEQVMKRNLSILGIVVILIALYGTVVFGDYIYYGVSGGPGVFTTLTTTGDATIGDDLDVTGYGTFGSTVTGGAAVITNGIRYGTTVFGGSAALSANFPNVRAIFTHSDTGLTSALNVGVGGEASGGVGVVGLAKANGGTDGYGFYSVATMTASGNTGDVYGLYTSATGSHASAIHYGIYSIATGGTLNYSFVGASGILLNQDDVDFNGDLDVAKTLYADTLILRDDDGHYLERAASGDGTADITGPIMPIHDGSTTEANSVPTYDESDSQWELPKLGVNGDFLATGTSKSSTYLGAPYFRANTTSLDTKVRITNNSYGFVVENATGRDIWEVAGAGTGSFAYGNTTGTEYVNVTHDGTDAHVTSTQALNLGAGAGEDIIFGNTLKVVDGATMTIQGNSVEWVNQSLVGAWVKHDHVRANGMATYATGGTKEIVGTNFGSWKLDAITEYLYFNTSVAATCWDGSTVWVVANVSLSGIETANDIINATLVYTSCADHEDIDADCATESIDIGHDIEAHAASGDMHTLTFNLTPANIAAEDTIGFRFYLDDVTTAPVVTAVNVHAFLIHYRSRCVSDERFVSIPAGG
jgi:hypothetical protein